MPAIISRRSHADELTKPRLGFEIYEDGWYCYRFITGGDAARGVVDVTFLRLGGAPPPDTYGVAFINRVTTVVASLDDAPGMCISWYRIRELYDEGILYGVADPSGPISVFVLHGIKIKKNLIV